MVEDGVTIRAVLEHVVRRAGAEPYAAAGVAQARERLAEREYALAMVDKNLGDGTGLELLKVIKEQHPRTDVIIVTAYASVESALEALRLGALDYVLKPFDPETVAHRLKLALERKRILAENVRMQRMLLQADRMASLGTLSAGVAHEINNPLSFVSANLEFLLTELGRVRRGTSDPDRLRMMDDALHEALAGIDRMRGVVKDLSAFARGSNDRRGPVDVHQVLETSIRIARHKIEERALLVRDFRDVPAVDANEGLLGQVFLNLLVNAAQAIPEGSASASQIRVVVCPSPQPRQVQIEFHDTGQGIPPDHLERIFEPFFTTKPIGVGTGLGLAICHGIIDSFHGRIEVESTPGKGSMFRVVLPEAGTVVSTGIGLTPPAGVVTR